MQRVKTWLKSLKVVKKRLKTWIKSLLRFIFPSNYIGIPWFFIDDFPLKITWSRRLFFVLSFLLLIYALYITKAIERPKSRKVKTEFWVPSYEFRYTSYEFKSTSYDFKSTSYKFNPRLYVIIISRTRFRVNPHYIVAWMSRNSLLETGAIFEV